MSKHTLTRAVACVAVVLLAPAALFMAAVFMQGSFDHPQRAEALVAWYSSRAWTLWLFLTLLPFAALVISGLSLLQRESLRVLREHLATFCVAATTLVAAAFLTVVVLHMAAS